MPAFPLSEFLLKIAAPLVEENSSAGGFGIEELEIELPALARFSGPKGRGGGGILLRTPEPFARPETRFARFRATIRRGPES